MHTLERTDTANIKANGEKSAEAWRARLNELAKLIRVEKPEKQDIEDFKLTLPYVDLAFADMASANEKALINLMTPEHDNALRLTMEYSLSQMKRDLGYDQSSAVERLVINQIVLCWLRMQVTEYRLTCNIEERMIDFYDKRLNAAQLRFNRACESLLRTRKMMIQTPALQINIANQQVVTG